ncbi:MAG: cellulose binding domain-containing protein [Clostridium sp.]
MFLRKGKTRLISLMITLCLTLTLIPVIKVNAAASGVPSKPVLSANQWGTDVDGNYDITMNLYYGNNGTSYKLYERFGFTGDWKVVGEGSLTDNSPGTQSAVVQIRNNKGIGMYNYYAEFINSYGATKSEVLSVKVGKDGDTKVLIEGVDDNSVELQTTISQGTHKYKIYNTQSPNSKFSVISNNTTTVTASIENGTTLVVNGVADGRSGLKIIDETTGDTRHIGVRVKKADGSLPGMPEYLSLGQVSEDTDNDLKFWKDVSYTDTNKRVDVRYIYINGGPITGWRTWTTEDGDRAKNYVKESLKHGMIPFFVYYNIPDDGESYELDMKHINDKTYMEAYYKDIKFFLDICKEFAGDETVGIILEPDFLGYMMQQAGKMPNEIPAVVDTAYSSGVLDKAKDPAFDNSVKGLVESINYTIRKYYKDAYFGWQFNIWSYDSHEVPRQGILHKTEFIGWEAGREFIKQVAKETADYYLAAGINSYDADFISIDKYGLDGAYEPGAKDDPKNSAWLWNADIWNNYLLYVKTLHETTKKPVILWQIPVGHLNSSQEPNPYNNGKFPDLTNDVQNYEDSAPTFFFGDTFKPGQGKRLDYFSTNEANDPKITKNGDTVTWGSHMQETKDAGVVSILFGAGVNASTDAVGSPAPDGYWWITKAQRYLKNPIPLDGKTPPPPIENLPLKPSLSSSTLNSNGNYTLTINIPSNSKATSYKLYETGATIKEGSVTSQAQSIKHVIENKPTGTYMYKVDLINQYGVTSSDIITVKVNNSTIPPIDKPKEGSITIDKPQNDGNYTLTLNIPTSSNATSYELYEGNKIAKSGSVTSQAQTIKVDFKDKASGTYTYRLDLINKDATTSSKPLVVTCNSIPQNGVKVEFFIASDWGSGANFELLITNNTMSDITDWNLVFDFDKKISTVHSAKLSSSGKTYTVKPESYNATIKKGETLKLTGACEGGTQGLDIYNVKMTHNGQTVGTPGDTNGDSVVDIVDLSAVAFDYNAKRGDTNFKQNLDLNNDGIIDIYDLVFVARRLS